MLIEDFPKLSGEVRAGHFVKLVIYPQKVKNKSEDMKDHILA